MAASQLETLRLFTALRLYRASWSGTLLLGLGLNDTGRALALASLAAGAATLLLEGDDKQLREASREGCATFTVTTLEEALRALKNEIRKGKAITVALSGDPLQHVREMVERGVLPDVIAAAVPSQDLPLRQLIQWGAQPLSGLSLHQQENAIDLTEMLHPLEAAYLHREETAKTMAERRAQDARLAQQQQGEELVATINRRWLHTAPTLFPRSLDRAIWVSRQ